MELSDAATTVWTVSLALGLVVTVVVTVLLYMIERVGVTIDERASRIWDTGQRVANNTVHIPTLYRINERAAEILETATRIDAGAAAIEAHASGCPGCPQCIREH